VKTWFPKSLLFQILNLYRYATVDAADIGQLSARERNRLKRKQKRSAREGEEGGGGPAAKRAKGGGGGGGGGGEGGAGGSAADAELLAAEAAEEEEEAAEVEAGGWPLARTCEALAYSLFAPRWEERHGGAVDVESS
jgi:TATA-binding protein-associated factor